MLDYIKKVLKNKLFINFSCATILALLAYLILIGLSPNKLNFWMDFNGNYDLVNYFFKNFFAWNNNILGLFQFSVFANIPFYMYVKTIYSLFGFTTGTYFVYYFATLLSLLSGFYLTKIILKSNALALTIAPIFVINPVFLYYLYGTGTVTFLLALSGINLGLAFTYKHLEKADDKKYLIGAIFSSLLVTHPFVFPFYCLLLGYLLLADKRFRSAIVFLTGTLLINIFWILPFASSLIYKGSELFGSYTSGLINTFATNGLYQYSLSFLGRSYPFLTDLFGRFGNIFAFIFICLWIAIVYYSFVTSKKYAKYWPLVIFLLIFSFGPRGVLGGVFNFLLINIPFFALFRSYQNVFIVLFPLTLFVLLLIAKDNSLIKKYLPLAVVAIVLIFFVFKNTALVTRGADMPSEYFKAEQIIDSDKSTNKVLILPTTDYDYYDWDQPKNSSKQDKYFIEAFFDKGAVFYRPTIDNHVIKDAFNGLYNDSNFDYNALENLGIKYILVRKDLMYADRQYFQPFTATINQSLTEKLIGTNNLELYKIKSNISEIESKNVVFTKVNPVRYDVLIKDLSKTQDLKLLEQFNSGWRLIIEPYSTKGFCNAPVSHDTAANVEECPLENGSIDFDELKYLLGRKTNFVHQSDELFGNVWKLDSAKIKNQLPADYYSVNKDNSINVRLTIYFMPQLFFYIGVLLSLITATVLLVYYSIRPTAKDAHK